MSDLLSDIEHCIRSRQLLREGQPVVVAVSGGLDSMVLLHLLHRLSQKYDWELTVAHFNHQLRGRASEADERLVVRTAQKLRVPVVTRRGDVRALARKQGVSIEMAARELRHAFLASTALRVRPATVALAQHADDQLEQFFLRLLRGSGGDGLSGMKWRTSSPVDASVELVRPLLASSKATLLQYAQIEKIPYREDATNTSLDFQRNRIRNELLPLLKAQYQPNLEEVINRAMEIISAEADFASSAAASWVKKALGSKCGEPNTRARPAKVKSSAPPPDHASENLNALSHRLVASSTGSFGHLPVAVQRRCLQSQLFELGVSPEFDLIEKLRLEPEARVCIRSSGVKPSGTDPGGIRVLVRDTSGIVRWGEHSGPRSFKAETLELELASDAGETDFGGILLAWSVKPGRFRRIPTRRAGFEVFDADKVGSPIVLRFWRPGDRFQPIGMNCSVKLQDFLTNQKVPAPRRRELVLGISQGGEVFWVEGQRISERFKLTKSTIRRLHWSWQPF